MGITRFPSAGRGTGNAMTRRDLLMRGRDLGLGLAAASFLAACGSDNSGGSGGSGDQLTLFSWGYGYQSTAHNVLIPKFKKTHPGSSVSLQIGTNADNYSQILAQKSDPTLSGGLFNQTYAYKGVDDKLWVPFDRKSLPNYADIDFSQSPETGGITFGVQPFGIGYNPKYVDPPKSIMDIFNPKYKGKIGAIDGGYDIYQITAVAVGADPNDVEAGIKVWSKHKDLLGPWTSSPADTNQLLDTGELWICPGYGGLIGADRDLGKSVQFTMVEEGATAVDDIVQLIGGFDDEVTRATQEYLGLYLGPQAQALWPTKVNTSPVLNGVKLPPDVAKRPEYVPVSEFDRFLKYDPKQIAANVSKYEQLIKEELKS